MIYLIINATAPQTVDKLGAGIIPAPSLSTV